MENSDIDLDLDKDLDKDLDLGLDKDLGLGEDEEDDVEPTSFSFPSSPVTLRKDDLQSIIDAWNELGLAKVIKITANSERYKMLKARLKEYGIESVIEAIRKIKEQPFLMGYNNNGWAISFDWLVKPNNFPKVLEGNYISHREQQSGNILRDWLNESKKKDEEIIIEEGGFDF